MSTANMSSASTTANTEPRTLKLNAKDNVIVAVDAVPAGVTVVGIPAREVKREAPRKSEFSAYAASGDLPDPVARAMEALAGELSDLRQKVAELEDKLAEAQSARGEPPLSVVGSNEMPRKGAIR